MTDRIDDPVLDDDLAARFARLRALDAPDTWERATERGASSKRVHVGPTRWWAATAAIVLVIGGVVAVASTRGGDPLAEPLPSTPTSGSRVEPGASVPSSTLANDGHSDPYGAATVEPATARSGDIVSVTPRDLIEPTCGGFGAIFLVDGPSPVRIGVVGPDGGWTPEAQRPTIPACLPPATSEAVSFEIPDDAISGVVSICRTVEFSESACGPLTIVDASDNAEIVVMPVVEGLIEGDAVRTLRALGLIVQVDRVEVDVRSNSGGRIISQSPAAATQLASGDAVAITVGQAVGAISATTSP